MERSTRLAASLRYALYGTGLALLASGAAWLYFRYGLPAPSRPRGALSASMQVHGAAAMVVLALIGTSLSKHVIARMNDQSFRFWTRWTVMTLGLFYLASGVWTLLK